MKRSGLQETSMEVTVGAFMFMVLLALGFFTIVLSRQNIFKPSYRMDVVFENVKGLREGDNVFVRGVSVGKIKTLQIKSDGVHVSVNLDQPVKLHEDYAIEILPSSVLGGRYLNIYEGSHGAVEISQGEVIKGLTPVDLIDEATKTTQLIKKALVEGGIIENLKSTMTQLNEVTAKLSKGEGTIGKLMMDDKVYNDLRDITASLKELSERAAKGKGTIGKLLSEDDRLYDNLAEASVSLRRIASSIEKGEGTIGKLMMDDKVYNDLRDITANLKELSERAAKGKGTIGKLLSEDDRLYDNLVEASVSLKKIASSIEKGDGTVGKLVKDDRLYNELFMTIHEARAAIDDYREVSPITTFSSIFFGAF